MLDKAKLLSKKTFTEADSFGDIFDDENLSYGWSRNPSDLRQYTNLIDKNFELELSLKDSYKKIEAKDLYSHYYIGKFKNKVFSGVRLTFNNPSMEKSLPSEWAGFCYNKTFPELNLSDERYCEVTRFAIEEEYRRTPQHYHEFFRAAQEITFEQNIKYMFLYAEKSRARLYCAVAKDFFKRKDIKVCDFSDWKGYENLAWKKEFNVIAFENKLFQNSN